MAMTELVRSERVALLDNVNVQRQHTTQALSEERIAVIGALTEERMATVSALNATVDSKLPRIKGLIDHFFVRVLQVLGLLVVTATVLGSIALRWRRMPQG